MAVALPSAPSPAVERVAAWLAGLGHEREPSLAMAANLLGEALEDPRLRRRWGHLTMTPHERQELADVLLARRVLMEGAFLSLEGNGVREGAVLSAHALCEAVQPRRPIRLSLGGAAAHAEQVVAARARLAGELESIDELVEAALQPKDGDGDGDGEPLQAGMGGGKAKPRVVHLQNRLNMLGHRVAADGKFGPVTEESVKDFQAKAGLEPTGVVDDETTLALRHGRRVVEVGPAAVVAPNVETPLADVGDGDPNKETVSKPVTTSAGEREAAASKAAPRLGQGVGEKASKDVRQLQLHLGAAGFPVTQDGKFGPKTQGAVKKFQRRHGLEPSGEGDDRTRRALRDAARANLREGAMSDSAITEAVRACPTCGGPMRPNGTVCQRGHRLNQARRPVQESAQTAALSVTHAPIGKGGVNWITKTAPGNTGQLPAYIQNVRNAIMRDGKPESEATEIAIGRIKDWAAGEGGVSDEVKAAAAKAIAEWEALRGKSHAQSASKLAEADTPADFPEYLACPSCHAKVLPPYEACPRGHRVAEAKVLRHALINSVTFERDVECLLRECAELQETWADFDAQRHTAHWGGMVKSGPMPGQPHKDSPGRGPSGKMRNFEAMSGPKLAATLEALMVHGEDHEAHHAAMKAAGKKLGVKVFGRPPSAPAEKVHSLLECAVCGAHSPAGAKVCQRGHRLEETWSDAAREAALAKRKTGTGIKKNYYVMQNVGKARHVVNFHDGVKTHADGSPFYDMHIASNKRDRDAFVAGLQRSGYVERGHLQEAIGHIDKGAFHRWLGKSEDEPITEADIARGLAAGGHPAKMANFARNFGVGK